MYSLIVFFNASLMEECTLREFENVVPRRIFGPKREELTG